MAAMPLDEQAIFEVARKIDAREAREAYLVQICGDEAAIERRVRALLKAHDESVSFLESPAARLPATADEQPLTERPGAVIGPYKLLQQIGEGGMGVVYMAEQEQPIRRRVALKIIKPGMDSAQVIARFEAERQALALMDHQNIAKVLDAGTTDSGRPYFVMELVHGVPITQYCDDHHLTPKERLELFLPVCHAVQHAHQKGIIHRDLKPSNVLVCLYDGVAVPKVIDFGVAKATGQQLTERTMFTQFGSLVGTLEYMSPEQAEMSQLGIDTRSDVYSMGVMLYELLTGTTPLERHRLREAGFDEIRRLIREEDPPKPSTRLSNSGVALAAISAQRQTEPAKLTRLVRGELDWIVMKALEKDRNHRYESANGLARDVERYLKDEPVEACPPTAGYRLRKFARKHKAGLATAVGFAVLLVLGTAVSAWLAVLAQANENKANAHAAQAGQKEQEAKKERDEAQRQRDEVRALNEKLQAKEAQLRNTLYAAHMNLAQQAWEAGGTERVREFLEQQRPKAGETDLRAFEWYYLYRLCHGELLTLNHGHGAFSVAYSPDGKRVASGSSNKTVKVWDAQTGQELLSLNGAGINVAFSPDGKRLASPGGGDLKVWDAQTGHELLTCKGHTGGVVSVAFSPDGKRLASAGANWDEQQRKYLPGEVKVWDAQTGRELLSLKAHTTHSWPNSYIAFSPNGKRLAAADNKAVKVWDAQTGQELLSLNGHTDEVYGVAYRPDGKRLVSWASGPDDDVSIVKVWDAQTGQELLSLKKGVGVVAYSPDGKRLANGSSDSTVEVWDAETGQELLSFKGHDGEVASVAFSPDGKRLASLGFWDGTVRVWDAQTGQKPLTLRGAAASSVASVAISPDGKRVASGGKGRPGSGPGVLQVWDTQSGQEIFTLKGHTAQVTTVTYSPDGKRLASGSGDKTVKVWDAQTGQETLAFKGHTGEIYSVAFSPDSKHLASGAGGTWDETKKAYVGVEVKVWDAQTGKEILTCSGHTRDVRSVVFSRDGKRLASASEDGTLKVWNAQTGQETLTIKGHTSPIGSLVFSPDGKRLASAGAWWLDSTVKVWDAQTGHELLTCKGHTGGVRSVAFSPDGKRLVSTGRDGLKVWDAQTGQELLTMKGATAPVAFSPDGHWLTSGSNDGTVTIWDATPLPEKP
jgi:WD40 repeat protein/serine/threonine protein kinase